MRVSILALVLLAVPGLVPGLALAQDPPAHGQTLGVVHIYGRHPAPITLFVPRARVHFDRADGSHHAVDQIVESVAHAPF